MGCKLMLDYFHSLPSVEVYWKLKLAWRVPGWLRLRSASLKSYANWCHIRSYCWWKKSQTTTWDVHTLVNDGERLPFPQLVSLPDFVHQQYHQVPFNKNILGMIQQLISKVQSRPQGNLEQFVTGGKCKAPHLPSEFLEGGMFFFK